MKHLKLRIAWSVACGALCLVLFAFWVRSDTRWDSPFGPLAMPYSFQFNSLKGHLFFAILKEPPGKQIAWTWRTYDVTSLTTTGVTGSTNWRFTWKFNALGLGLVKSALGTHLVLPYWLLVALSITLAAAPWLRWQFSLRTLLIAMTLTAMLLGLGVYVLRK